MSNGGATVPSAVFNAKSDAAAEGDNPEDGVDPPSSAAAASNGHKGINGGGGGADEKEDADCCTKSSRTSPAAVFPDPIELKKQLAKTLKRQNSSSSTTSNMANGGGGSAATASSASPHNDCGEGGESVSAAATIDSPPTGVGNSNSESPTVPADAAGVPTAVEEVLDEETVSLNGGMNGGENNSDEGENGNHNNSEIEEMMTAFSELHEDHDNIHHHSSSPSKGGGSPQKSDKPNGHHLVDHHPPPSRVVEVDKVALAEERISSLNEKQVSLERRFRALNKRVNAARYRRLGAHIADEISEFRDYAVASMPNNQQQASLTSPTGINNANNRLLHPNNASPSKQQSSTTTTPFNPPSSLPGPSTSSAPLLSSSTFPPNSISQEASTSSTYISRDASAESCDNKNRTSNNSAGTSSANVESRPGLDSPPQKQITPASVKAADVVKSNLSSLLDPSSKSSTMGLQLTSRPSASEKRRTNDVLAQMEANMQHLVQDYDSDATESSSGGESCDEFDNFSRNANLYLPVKKRAKWTWLTNRASIAAKWNWLTSQISDLEFRIRQQNEFYRHIKHTKGPVVLGDPVVSWPPHARKAVQPAAGAESEIPMNCQPVVRDYSRLVDNSGRKIIIKQPVNKQQDSTAANPSSSDIEDSTATACRTRPIKLKGRRRIISTQGHFRTGLRAAKEVGVRCDCLQSQFWCAVCFGRTYHNQAPDPVTQEERQVAALLDHSYHAVLSNKEDLPLSLHLMKKLKDRSWLKRERKKSSDEKEGKSGKVLDEEAIARKKAKKAEREANKALARAEGKEEKRGRKKKYKNSEEAAEAAARKKAKKVDKMLKKEKLLALKKLKKANKKNKFNKNNVLKVRTFNNFNKRRKSLSMSHQNTLYSDEDEDNSDLDSPLPSPAAAMTTREKSNRGGQDQESTPSSNAAWAEHIRKKRETAYDIDNIVIPYSMNVNRIERIQYKEIVTPTWREVGQGSKVGGPKKTDVSIEGGGEQQLPPTTPVKEKPNNTMPSTADDEEDVSESAFIVRHQKAEVEEQRRWQLSILKAHGSGAAANFTTSGGQRGSQRSRRQDSVRTDITTPGGSGYNTPDHPMSPATPASAAGLVESVEVVTRPSTPLNADVDMATPSTPGPSTSASSSGLALIRNRRRTSSTTKSRDRHVSEDTQYSSRCVTPTNNSQQQQHVSFSEDSQQRPFESRMFPLREDEFDAILRDESETKEKQQQQNEQRPQRSQQQRLSTEKVKRRRSRGSSIEDEDAVISDVESSDDDDISSEDEVDEDELMNSEEEEMEDEDEDEEELESDPDFEAAPSTSSEPPTKKSLKNKHSLSLKMPKR